MGWTMQIRHSEIGRIMEALDVRQDGLIDYDEFVASVAAEQSKLTDAKLQAAFNYMDSDSDGVVCTSASQCLYTARFHFEACTQESCQLQGIYDMLMTLMGPYNEVN